MLLISVSYCNSVCRAGETFKQLQGIMNHPGGTVLVWNETSCSRTKHAGATFSFYAHQLWNQHPWAVQKLLVHLTLAWKLCSQLLFLKTGSSCLSFFICFSVVMCSFLFLCLCLIFLCFHRILHSRFIVLGHYDLV